MSPTKRDTRAPEGSAAADPTGAAIPAEATLPPDEQHSTFQQLDSLYSAAASATQAVGGSNLADPLSLPDKS